MSKPSNAQNSKIELRSIVNERLTTASKFYEAYCPIYLGKVPKQKVNQLAKSHSVYTEILKLIGEYNEQRSLRPLIHDKLLDLQLFRPKITFGKKGYNNLIRVLLKMENGIEGCLLPKYKGNNSKFSQDESLLLLWIEELYGLKERLSLRQIADQIAKRYKSLGNSDSPSYSLIKVLFRKGDIKNKTLRSREGVDSELSLMPAINKQRPKHPGECWQIDGTRLNKPFYNPTAKRNVSFLSIVIVIDVHSNKIIGFSFGNNEDETTLRAALKMAAIKTGHLPKRILRDNAPSFKSDQWRNLENELRLRGVRVDRTPPRSGRSKPHIEKTIDILERSFFNLIPDFIGSGVRAKNRMHDDAIVESLKLKSLWTKQEVIGEATKKILQFNNHHFNNRKSPNELYSLTPVQGTILNPHDIAFLFWTTKTRIIVKNSQVRFTHLKVDYIFDLNVKPSEWTYLNFKSYQVKFDTELNGNLSSDSIYLFDEDDNFICEGTIRPDVADDPLGRTHEELELVKLTQEKKREFREFQKQRKGDLKKEIADAYGVEALDIINHLNADSKEEEKSAEDQSILRFIGETYLVSNDDFNRESRVVPIESRENLETIDDDAIRSKSKRKKLSRWTDLKDDDYDTWR